MKPAADRVLDALADPTRRVIFRRVADRPWSVGELARSLPVSRPAVSQHLAVLGRAALVEARAEGIRRFYRATPDGLRPLACWIDELREP
jgi:DNA-binding transcriptional ArsR family regulator